MKKYKDTLGDIFKGIIIASIIVCAYGTVAGFGSGNVAVGFICIGSALACLFVYWLISAISKIVICLREINDNSSVIRSYCESKMNQETTPPTVPEPISTENKE